MKANELRDMTTEELREERLRLLREQFNLRMLRGSSQLPQTHLCAGNGRRDIARVETVIAGEGRWLGKVRRKAQEAGEEAGGELGENVQGNARINERNRKPMPAMTPRRLPPRRMRMRK